MPPPPIPAQLHANSQSAVQNIPNHSTGHRFPYSLCVHTPPVKLNMLFAGEFSVEFDVELTVEFNLELSVMLSAKFLVKFDAVELAIRFEEVNLQYSNGV